MKKTVTTILSLALALILVSSLSSGVSYAHAKNKYKKVKVREVAILDCGFPVPLQLLVTGFHTNAVDDVPMIMVDIDNCDVAIVSLLDSKFKMANGSAGMHPMAATLFSRYTFLRTRTVRVLVETVKKDDDDD